MKESIARIVNDWDPIELFPGAPDDEYNREIHEIFEIFIESDDVNVEQLRDHIYYVFHDAFDETFTRTLEECKVIAIRILSTCTS